MSDIVERLFRWSKFGYGVDASSDMAEAAATISRLEWEKSKLREEVEAWRKRFPVAGFDGHSIVLRG